MPELPHRSQVCQLLGDRRACLEQAGQADPVCSGIDADSEQGSVSEDNPPPYLCSENCLGVYTPAVPALGRLPQKNGHDFKVSQGCTARDFLQNNKKEVVHLGPGLGARVTAASEWQAPSSGAQTELGPYGGFKTS